MLSVALMTLLGAAPAAPEVANSQPVEGVERRQAAPNGLYPIWENNGLVLGHQQATLGLNHVQLGVGDVVHFGVKPATLALRIPNLHAKVALFDTGEVAVAAQLAGYLVLPGAGEQFFSDQYAAPFANETPVLALPLSLGVTWRLTDWLNVHNTTTGLGVFASAPVENRATFGDFLTVEMMINPRHSLFVHAGEVGVWDHKFAVAGGSYRYRYDPMELRLGYFYRLDESGAHGAPLLGIGVVL